MAAVDNSRPQVVYGPSSTQQQLASRHNGTRPTRRPTGQRASLPGYSAAMPSSSHQAATGAMRSRSSDAAGRVDQSSTDADSRDRQYDSDLETESAYQRAMWNRIQQSRKDIQQIRTPLVDGFVPANSYREIYLKGVVDGRDPAAAGVGRSNHDPSAEIVDSGRLGLARAPANYIELNRRQFQQQQHGPKYGRRAVVYPTKTYSEMFAKKKQNELTYMNVGSKNVFGGVSTFLPFSSGCRCQDDPHGCPCRHHQQQYQQQQQQQEMRSNALDSHEQYRPDWNPDHMMFIPPHHQLHPHPQYHQLHRQQQGFDVPRAPQYAHLGRSIQMPLPPIPDERLYWHAAYPRDPGLGRGQWRPQGDDVIETRNYGDHEDRRDRSLPLGREPRGDRWSNYSTGGVTSSFPADNANNRYQRLDDDNRVNLQLNVTLVDPDDNTALPGGRVPANTVNDARFPAYGPRSTAGVDGSSMSMKYPEPPEHWRQTVDTARDTMRTSSRQIGPKELEAMSKIRRLRET